MLVYSEIFIHTYTYFCLYVYRFFFVIQLVAKRNETRQEFEEKANDIDLVTATDKEVEQLLIRGLLDAFPDHK